MCLAVISKPGRITPDDYARIWLEKMNPHRFWVTERIVLEKLRLGMNPWDTGRGQPLADAALMSIAPAGIINVGDPAQAYQDAFALAAMHQDGIERDAAATVAAAVAAALLPGTTVDAVLEVMRRYSSYEVRRLIEMALDLAAASADAGQFADAFYAAMLDRTFPCPPGLPWDPDRWVGPTSREALPAVVGVLRVSGADANQCIIEGASLGRDADTIASVVGCIAGSLHGASALRDDWIADCEAANQDLFTEAEGSAAGAGFRVTAERLIQALHQHRNATEERLTTLDAMLQDLEGRLARRV
jgi:ADP-ribosylglycohydrolase